MPELRAFSGSERERQRAEQGGEGGHHDRAKAQKARLLDRIARVAPRPLRLKREVDHHDGVLLDDADQEQDSDRGDDGELDVEQP